MAGRQAGVGCLRGLFMWNQLMIDLLRLCVAIDFGAYIEWRIRAIPSPANSFRFAHLAFHRLNAPYLEQNNLTQQKQTITSKTKTESKTGESGI